MEELRLWGARTYSGTGNTFGEIRSHESPLRELDFHHPVSPLAIAYTVTGSHQGDFLGIPATGRRISARGMQIARFQDGQIVERWCSSDQLGILQQIGMDPTTTG